MIKTDNLSGMTISGWNTKYSEILREFGYSRNQDQESAWLLNLIIENSFPTKKIRDIIRGKTVFVIGSGPSILSAVPFLKNFKDVPKIVADSAAKPLVENKIRPDIVVSDLDGDVNALIKLGKTQTILVVHAHGDNISKLQMVENFKNCLGTTQGKPLGKIHNFGGFTDGDRCVFLASHFRAKKIILFGMDFGSKTGKYSQTKSKDRKMKIKKLQRGKKLLEWLATKTGSALYTTSKPIKGFKKITYKDLEGTVYS